MEKALRNHLPDGHFKDVSEKRSKAMSAVKGKGNTTTERRLRSALASAGIAGWRMHPSHIPGRPDFFFADSRLAVFVDGCFWHGCPKCGHYPKTNASFWKAKIDGNRERDEQKTKELRQAGYDVIRFWEHELRQDLGRCVALTLAALPRRCLNASKSAGQAVRLNVLIP